MTPEAESLVRTLRTYSAEALAHAQMEIVALMEYKGATDSNGEEIEDEVYRNKVNSVLYTLGDLAGALSNEKEVRGDLQAK